MPIHSIELTPELDRFIKAKVKSGAFKDANEVMLAALQRFEREKDYEAKMDAIGLALDEGDASGVADGDVFADVRQQLGLPPRVVTA